MRARHGISWLIVGLLSSTACGPRVDSEARAQGDRRAGEPAADLPPLPTDKPPVDVLPLAGKRFAGAMIAQGKPITGSLRQGERSDHLLVLEAGRCYRVVGVGGDGVTDMDLFLYDPAGVQRNQALCVRCGAHEKAEPR